MLALAVMAGMYAVYHGPKGLEFIADQIHYKTNALANALSVLGYDVVEEPVFDTVKIRLHEDEKAKLKRLMTDLRINLNYFGKYILYFYLF